MKWAWGLSAAAHGLLLLGAAAVATCWTVIAGPPDFECRLASQRRIEPISSAPDRRTQGGPAPDPPRPIEDPRRAECWDRSERFPGWYIIYYDEDSVFCGTCLEEIYDDYQGRVLWVYRPSKRPRFGKPGTFKDRLEALANNRFNQPRLKRP